MKKNCKIQTTYGKNNTKQAEIPYSLGSLKVLKTIRLDQREKNLPLKNKLINNNKT